MTRLSARDYAQALAQAVAVVPAAKRTDVIMNFLQLLRRQRASNLLPRIMTHLQQLDDAERGVTRVEVTLPHDDAHVAKSLEKLLGKVVVDTTIDPRLIGGATIRIADELIDGSVRSQLTRLHTQLISSHA